MLRFPTMERMSTEDLLAIEKDLEADDTPESLHTKLVTIHNIQCAITMSRADRARSTHDRTRLEDVSANKDIGGQ